MLELLNVSKYYHNNGVTSLGLHNINLKFFKNEIVAITGESGSGKSTLLNVIAKNDTFDEGEILYKGNDTSYFSISDMDDFRKNTIGFIYQNYNIIESYSVLENVMLPLTLKGYSTKKAKERALELIQKVGLGHRIKSRGAKLSGGEKQRVAIARALASDCEILACDEPTGNLDSETGLEIIKLLKEVAKDRLVLIVTHNYEQLNGVATRRIKMKDGEVEEDEVIVPYTEEIKEALDLDYVPLPISIGAKVARNNIVFTPKKTMLLVFIFLTICLAALLMFQLISINVNRISVKSIYNNHVDSKVVAYHTDHSILSESDLVGYDYDKNPFYEDYELEFSIHKIDSNSAIDFSFPSYNNTGYYVERIEYTLTYGAMPKNSDEVLLVYPKGSQEEYDISRIMDRGSFAVVFYSGAMVKISGYAVSEDIDSITFLGNEVLKNIALSYELVFNMRLENGTSQHYLDPYYDPNFDGVKIVLPTLNKPLTNQFFIFRGYEITDYVSYEFDSSIGVPRVYFGGKCFSDLPIYEIAAYDSNWKALESQLESKGLAAVHASDATSMTELDKLLNNLVSYAFMVGASSLLVFVYIITYVILSRVYASKKKDYEILRTLGVSQRDMRYIVDFEILGITIFTIVLSYLFFLLLLFLLPEEIGFGSIDLITSIIYFVVTFIFAFAIAKRFNRKLFQFSISKSMRGDGAHA